MMSRLHYTLYLRRKLKLLLILCTTSDVEETWSKPPDFSSTQPLIILFRNIPLHTHVGFCN